ncbi:sugar transferase [Roseivirga sp. BDSF3-8]|uniref:sugar transferase n=1 Tax=Roseivirga sp. BDSF3-8 TaxID=3241598 RepID=UPI003531A280
MYQYVKRGFDLIISLTVFIMVSPLFLAIMLILSVTGEREVFYRQKRVGYRNEPFYILKFATMVKNSSKIGTGDITLRNDPRVTKVGRILRITKLNELPQILNVINGDMSLVGPRPLMPVSFENYSPEVQASIYNAKPGITGIGSIIFRDEEKMVSESGMEPRMFYSQFIFPYKGAVEMWYQRNSCFFTDLNLLLLTVWVVLNSDSRIYYKVFPDLPKETAQFA